MFGRVPELADVVLDHPSISRQHATAAWHPGRAAWLLTDLGSTHGTWVGDSRLGKVRSWPRYMPEPNRKGRPGAVGGGWRGLAGAGGGWEGLEA